MINPAVSLRITLDITPQKPESFAVLIDGEKIVAVGLNIEIPDGTQILDVTGKWITPGLIDAHSHAYFKSYY